MRAREVRRLRDQVRSGAYRPDVEALAGRMLDWLLESDAASRRSAPTIVRCSEEQERVHTPAMPPPLLIIDDDETILLTLTRFFGTRGFETTPARSVGTALAAIEASIAAKQPFAAIVTDLQLPDGDGGSIVKAAHDRLPRCPVLVMTGSASVSRSVEAMRLGAVTVLEKPLQLAALEAEVRQAMESQAELASALGDAEEAGIIGSSPAIRAVLDVILLAAPTDATVLVEGETGTGKELVAQALHRLSRRPSGPFVAVNCAALPESLLESELFGHVRGAFTGASEARQGRFRQAEGGTLFLDEIGELPLGLQAKLLRVLADRTVQPVGSDKVHKVDVRVIAASNRDLEGMVAQGKFRADLYYRLGIVPLRLPPLRERTEDVAQLAAHFLGQRGQGRKFTPAAVEALSRYPWPGNVRELENLVQRLTVLKPAGDLDVGDLPPQLRAGDARPAAPPVALPPDGVDLYAVLGELEDHLIREALKRAEGNQTLAARYLSLNRTTLVDKLRKLTRR